LDTASAVEAPPAEHLVVGALPWPRPRRSRHNRKAATAAVGPGEGRPHLVDLGITLDMELFLEKPQGYAQHEGENGGEQHGD
jgi:hypothetical protein